MSITDPNSTNYSHLNEPNLLNLHKAMSYDPYGNPIIRIDDTSAQHTSQNRVKISAYEVTDFATYAFGKDEDIWDEQLTGTATSVHAPYLGMVELTVGSAIGDQVLRQTKRVQRYIPGRSSEVSMAFLWQDPFLGIRRRFGLFDHLNGIYFEDGADGEYYCVIRRDTAGGPVENRVARSDWNVDRLDGTGPSGIVADPTAIQQMIIEYEWYGAGQVEFKFVIGNNSIPIHQFDHSNIVPYTWAAMASLPVRTEITNITGAAGSHKFWQGSHSFTTEGDTTLLGQQNNISSAITGTTLALANVFYPVLAIRLKTGALNSVVIPDIFSGATLDNTNVFVRVIEGAEVTGGTWVSYNNNSPVEYNITPTSFTGGNLVETKYANASNQGSLNYFPERSITQLRRNTATVLGDTASTFLVALAASTSNKSGWASLGWIEVR